MLSRRDMAIWAACFVAVSALIVVTGFASDDPDSALYAGISSRLTALPLSSWIAPQWWGYWNLDGWFREHPAGVFFLPTLLSRTGIPAVQAAYIVGIAIGLVSLIGIGSLVARVTAPGDGRASLVLLQLIPVAFLFRIRSNHEYPMLLGLVGTLIALDRVRQSWWAVLLLAASLTFALMVKGVFVIVVFIAAGLWIVLNPPRTSGGAWRPIAAMALAIAVMAGVAVWYDAVYVRETGEPFWVQYWAKQVAPATAASPMHGALAFVAHIGFYAAVVLWHAAPWSLAIVGTVWTVRRAITAAWRRLPATESRGIAFVAAFALLVIGLLGPSSRYAERYVFSVTFAVAALGAVLASRRWPPVTRALQSLDQRVPALPAFVWLGLMLIRLGVGPLLPRIF